MRVSDGAAYPTAGQITPVFIAEQALEYENFLAARMKIALQSESDIVHASVGRVQGKKALFRGHAVAACPDPGV